MPWGGGAQGTESAASGLGKASHRKRGAPALPRDQPVTRETRKRDDAPELAAPIHQEISLPQGSCAN